MTTFTRPQLLAGLLTAAVAAGVVGALVIIGSPAEERARRRDSGRVGDLTSIENAVTSWHRRFNTLPGSLDSLVDREAIWLRLRDVQTGVPYEYTLLDSLSYQLCAVFERADTLPSHSMAPPAWNHGAGRHCFKRTPPVRAVMGDG